MVQLMTFAGGTSDRPGGVTPDLFRGTLRRSGDDSIVWMFEIAGRVSDEEVLHVNRVGAVGQRFQLLSP